jgi:hypothetical protein
MTFETLVYIIVFVNLVLTIELWRRAARRPEKLKKKFFKRLFNTKPITPKHQPFGTSSAETVKPSEN